MKPITPDSAAKLRAEMENQIRVLHIQATAARRRAECGTVGWRTKQTDDAKYAETQIRKLRAEIIKLNRRERVTA